MRLRPLFLVMFCILHACSSSDDSNNNGTNGTLSDASNGLNDISNNFTPDSLAVEGLLNSAFTSPRSQNADPCEGSDSLWDCQPNLLRLYYDLAHGFLDSMRSRLAVYAKDLGELEDTAEPKEIEISTELGPQTLQYTKSGDDFAVLVSNGPGGTPVFHARSNAGTTLVQVGNFGDEDGGDGTLQVEYTYTDENNWEAEFYIIDPECDEADVRKPERIKILVSRAEGLWQGKAMMYSSRWSASSPTCATEVDDATATNLYTDFVGNDDVAKAKMFIMRRTVEDFTAENENAHGIPVCDLLGCSTEDQNTIGNPYCVHKDSLEATWEDACSDNQTIAEAEFGPFSDWTLPNQLYNETVELPSSL